MQDVLSQRGWKLFQSLVSKPGVGAQIGSPIPRGPSFRGLLTRNPLPEIIEGHVRISVPNFTRPKYVITSKVV